MWDLLMKYLCPRDFRRGEMEENMRSFVLFNTALGMEERIGKSMKKPQAQTCGGNTVDLMLR